jgi:WD40 repeat protein
VRLTLKGHNSGVCTVAFSPDGKRLVSGSWDKTVKVWDALTGQETFTLQGHTDAVVSVAFSPDGKRHASASLATNACAVALGNFRAIFVSLYAGSPWQSGSRRTFLLASGDGYGLTFRQLPSNHWSPDHHLWGNSLPLLGGDALAPPRKWGATRDGG